MPAERGIALSIERDQSLFDGRNLLHYHAAPPHQSYLRPYASSADEARGAAGQETQLEIPSVLSKSAGTMSKPIVLSRFFFPPNCGTTPP